MTSPDPGKVTPPEAVLLSVECSAAYRRLLDVVYREGTDAVKEAFGEFTRVLITVMGAEVSDG